MQFKAVFLMALLTALTNATAVPKGVSCDSPYHPCNLVGQYEKCSDEWMRVMKEYVFIPSLVRSAAWVSV